MNASGSRTSVDLDTPSQAVPTLHPDAPIDPALSEAGQPDPTEDLNSSSEQLTTPQTSTDRPASISWLELVQAPDVAVVAHSIIPHKKSTQQLLEETRARMWLNTDSTRISHVLIVSTLAIVLRDTARTEQQRTDQDPDSNHRNPCFQKAVRLELTYLQEHGLKLRRGIQEDKPQWALHSALAVGILLSPKRMLTLDDGIICVFDNFVELTVLPKSTLLQRALIQHILTMSPSFALVNGMYGIADNGDGEVLSLDSAFYIDLLRKLLLPGWYERSWCLVPHFSESIISWLPSYSLEWSAKTMFRYRFETSHTSSWVAELSACRELSQAERGRSLTIIENGFTHLSLLGDELFVDSAGTISQQRQDGNTGIDSMNTMICDMYASVSE